MPVTLWNSVLDILGDGSKSKMDLALALVEAIVGEPLPVEDGRVWSDALHGHASDIEAAIPGERVGEPFITRESGAEILTWRWHPMYSVKNPQWFKDHAGHIARAMRVLVGWTSRFSPPRGGRTRHHVSPDSPGKLGPWNPDMEHWWPTSWYQMGRAIDIKDLELCRRPLEAKNAHVYREWLDEVARKARHGEQEQAPW